MSAWERPSCAMFQGCFSGQGACSGTWLWVGMDGGSLIFPPLSNLVHFIMRTVVICFCFPPLLLFLSASISGFLFFLVEETEKSCEEEDKSQNSHLLSSRYCLDETEMCPWALYRAWTAVVPPRHGSVTSFAQQIRSGISWLSVSLVPFQSPSTPWCISFLS